MKLDEQLLHFPTVQLEVEHVLMKKMHQIYSLEHVWRARNRMRVNIFGSSIAILKKSNIGLCMEYEWDYHSDIRLSKYLS